MARYCETCPLLDAVDAVAEKLKGVLPCAQPSTGRHERWLTPRQAAEAMGVSVRWLQRRRHKLDFVTPLPHARRGWRVCAEKFARYLAKR